MRFRSELPSLIVLAVLCVRAVVATNHRYWAVLYDKGEHTKLSADECTAELTSYEVNEAQWNHQLVTDAAASIMDPASPSWETTAGAHSVGERCAPPGNSNSAHQPRCFV